MYFYKTKLIKANNNIYIYFNKRKFIYLKIINKIKIYNIIFISFN